MGLRIMQSRIGMVGGTLIIERNPTAARAWLAPRQSNPKHGHEK